MKKTILKYLSLFGLCLTQLCFIASAEAEIFKCTNEKGNIYYNDRPCPVNDEEKKIRAEKDPLNGYIPPSFVEDMESPNSNRGVAVGGGDPRTIDERSRSDDGNEEQEKAESDNNRDRGGAESVHASDEEDSSDGNYSDAHLSQVSKRKNVVKANLSTSQENGEKGSKVAQVVTPKLKRQLINVKRTFE